MSQKAHDEFQKVRAQALRDGATVESWLDALIHGVVQARMAVEASKQLEMPVGEKFRDDCITTFHQIEEDLATLEEKVEKRNVREDKAHRNIERKHGRD